MLVRIADVDCLSLLWRTDCLCICANNFEQWMGIAANALDFSFDTMEEIQRIIGLFASYCVEAAVINPKYCPLAAASMKSANPASDIHDKINKIMSNLTQTNQFVDNRYLFDLDDFIYITIGALQGVSGWGTYAQFLLDAESAVAVQSGQLTKRSLSNDSVLAFSNQPTRDELAGYFQWFAVDAVRCLDQSFGGIDPQDFNNNSLVN